MYAVLRQKKINLLHLAEFSSAMLDELTVALTHRVSPSSQWGWLWKDHKNIAVKQFENTHESISSENPMIMEIHNCEPP